MSCSQARAQRRMETKRKKNILNCVSSTLPNKIDMMKNENGKPFIFDEARMRGIFSYIEKSYQKRGGVVLNPFYANMTGNEKRLCEKRAELCMYTLPTGEELCYVFHAEKEGNPLYHQGALNNVFKDCNGEKYVFIVIPDDENYSIWIPKNIKYPNTPSCSVNVKIATISRKGNTIDPEEDRQNKPKRYDVGNLLSIDGNNLRDIMTAEQKKIFPYAFVLKLSVISDEDMVAFRKSIHPKASKNIVWVDSFYQDELISFLQMRAVNRFLFSMFCLKYLNLQTEEEIDSFEFIAINKDGTRLTGKAGHLGIPDWKNFLTEYEQLKKEMVDFVHANCA